MGQRQGPSCPRTTCRISMHQEVFSYLNLRHFLLKVHHPRIQPTLTTTHPPLRNHSIHTRLSSIMQFIVQSYNDDSANSSSHSSSMSISSVSAITSMQADSPTLPRLEPLSPVPSTRTFGSPTPRKLVFGTAEYIEPIHLCPVKCEDADSEDESLPVLPPTNITAQYPIEVLTKIEHFKSVHNARETEAKQLSPISDTNINTNTAPTDEPLTDTEAATALMVLGTTAIFKENTQQQSHCSRQIDWLHRILANGQPPDQDATKAYRPATCLSQYHCPPFTWQLAWTDPFYLPYMQTHMPHLHKMAPGSAISSPQWWCT